jgi:arginyl-tRNA synthetase
MKTRSGENVPLREVLEEAIARARQLVHEKNPDLDKRRKAKSRRSSGSAP